MELFARYELVKNQEGYTLVLYAEKQTSEFAEEFFGGLKSSGKALKKDSLTYLQHYIEENFKGIKIDTVKIMLGSVLLATIAYSGAGDQAVSTQRPPVQAPVSQSPVQETPISQAPVTQKPVEQVQQQPEASVTPNTGTKGNDSGNRPETPAVGSANLILVNKVHHLSSGYVPSKLVYPQVAAPNKSKTLMTPEAAKALENLFAKAKEEGIQLAAISGYRSYSRQESIFASNIQKYGSAEAANQFSARPGESEHQTGLAMDVSSASMNYTLQQSFQDTPEGQWLKENAAQFGFIIRYQKGKEAITGYQFEPWHIRYVGQGTAMAITSSGLALEQYLSGS